MSEPAHGNRAGIRWRRRRISVFLPRQGTPPPEVISAQLPTSFADLMRVLRDFPPFVACFAILLLFWNEHYRFFRRYGLEDAFTRSSTRRSCSWCSSPCIR